MRLYENKTLLWLGLVFILALFLLVSFIDNRLLPLPLQETTLEIEGLFSLVNVWEDQNGFPMIEAHNEHDLFFMQGYIGFENRPSQTLRQRAMLMGELSSVLGEEYLGMDIHFRTLSLRILAKEQVKAMDEETRAVFVAYLHGLNASIARLRKESGLSHYQGFSLAPWVLEDLVVNLFLPSLFSGSNLSIELLNQRLINELGFERARKFFPFTFNSYRDARQLDYGSYPASVDMVENLSLKGVKFLLQGLNRSHAKIVSASGSNNWAVNASKSSTGGALLSNDPHVDVRELPNIYQGFGLTSPQGRAVGVSVAGIPGLMIGRNENVAFGLTLAYVDNQDLFVEKVNPANENEYWEAGKWTPFIEREEVIMVAQSMGRVKEVILPVRRTSRGLVIHEGVIGDHAPRVLSLSWTLFDPPSKRLAIAHWLFAQNIQEAREALLSMENWYFNYLLADASGKIEHVMTGRVPVRQDSSAGLYPRQPRALMEGVAYLSEDSKPKLDKEKGFLLTANQDIKTTNYPYPWLGSGYAPSYRSKRLHSLLRTATEGDSLINPEQSWSWLTDTYDLVAERWNAIFLHKIDKMGNRYKPFTTILSSYDFKARHDDRASLLFAYIWQEFVSETYRKVLGEELAFYYLRESGVWPDRLEDYLLRGDESLWQAGGGLDATLERVLHRVLDNWQVLVHPEREVWGDRHFVRFNLGKDSLILPLSGSSYTVALATYSILDNSFAAKTIQSLKMLADMSQKETLTLILPGGVKESLSLSSRASQIEQWYLNEPIEVSLSAAAVERNKSRSYQVVPIVGSAHIP